MSETYYKKKRIKKGIAKSDMAKELGLSYIRYSAIEKGEIKMPTKLMDKFNEIINRGARNDIEKLNNEDVVNVFWNEITAKDENGQFELLNKCREFNINSYRRLAELLGCSNGTLSHYLNGYYKPNYDFKNKLYQFFQDENNIQLPNNNDKPNKPNKTTDDITTRRGRACKKKNLLEFFEDTDFVKTLEDMNMTIIDFAKASGISVNATRGMVNKRTIPAEKTLLKAKKYIDDYYHQVLPEDKLENCFPDIPESEAEITTTTTDFVTNVNVDSNPIINRYRDEMANNCELIEIFKNKIEELEVRNKVCEEVLKVVDEIRNEG